MSRGRKPIVLMIGSGLHKHVLQNQRCPLSDWETLLRATAARAGLKFGRSDCKSPPVVWEQLILEGVRHGLRDVSGQRVERSLQPHQVEGHLRQWVVQVLKACALMHQDTYANHRSVMALSAFVRSHEIIVVDFNFDDLLKSALGFKAKPVKGELRRGRNFPGRDSDRRNLCEHWKLAEKGRSTMWKPHGSVSTPNSIRLGFRDYGLQPMVYAWAFSQYKESSRKKSDRVPGRRTDSTWIARMMEHECRVIGLGLGPDEWGLQWLFVQRARNLANRRGATRAVIYVEGVKHLPLGAQTQALSSWDECWQSVVSLSESSESGD